MVYLLLTLILQILWYVMLSPSWVVRPSKRHVEVSSPFKWHVKFNIGLSSPFKWHIKFKIGLSSPFKCHVQVGSSAFQRDKIGFSSPFKWHIMFKLGRPSFKETGSGRHLTSNDMLSSSRLVRLSKRQDWVVISLQMTCYVQVGSSTFQKDKIGLSSPSKWHIKFKLGRPPFKRQDWVVISLQMTC